jgi:hypothetical protein
VRRSKAICHSDAAAHALIASAEYDGEMENFHYTQEVDDRWHVFPCHTLVDITVTRHIIS